MKLRQQKKLVVKSLIAILLLGGCSGNPTAGDASSGIDRSKVALAVDSQKRTDDSRGSAAGMNIQAGAPRLWQNGPTKKELLRARTSRKRTAVRMKGLGGIGAPVLDVDAVRVR